MNRGFHIVGLSDLDTFTNGLYTLCQDVESRGGSVLSISHSSVMDDGVPLYSAVIFVDHGHAARDDFYETHRYWGHDQYGNPMYVRINDES